MTIGREVSHGRTRLDLYEEPAHLREASSGGNEFLRQLPKPLKTHQVHAA